MKHHEAFNQSHASLYDEQWKKLAPMTGGLHFLIKILLKNLPEDAHILCVGAGTGAEIMALASAFPKWRFTAVEPSGPMLEVCRAKLQEAGFLSRCHLHHGYLSTLHANVKFNAATAILVSQFCMNKTERIQFFKEINDSLKSESYLISADLSSPESPQTAEDLLETWKKALLFADIPEEKAQAATASWGKQVAISQENEIEDIIREAGFKKTCHFYQSLFIHGWYSLTS